MFSSSNPLSIQNQFLLKPEYLDLMISLAMLPLLAGVLGQQQLFKCVLTLGGWSEGVFQGISLPFLEISK